MLTARLTNAANVMFGPERAVTALVWLDQHFEHERNAAAALKLSNGSLEKLKNTFERYPDFRDLLMNAGFGHDVLAHEGWLQDLVRQESEIR